MHINSAGILLLEVFLYILPIILALKVRGKEPSSSLMGTDLRLTIHQTSAYITGLHM